jgi:hypothetical protein
MDEAELQKEILSNMRFYADVRFKQLTLFLTATTLAFGGIAQFPGRSLIGPFTVRGALAVFGTLFTLAMLVLEFRAAAYWVAHREMVKQLWPQPNEPTGRWTALRHVNATNAILALYLSILAGWLCLAHVFVLTTLGLVMWLLVVLFVIAALVKAYQPLWGPRGTSVTPPSH